MISTSPAPIPVTRPVSSTTATAVSPDAQANSAPATVWPFASVAVATSRNVSPNHNRGRIRRQPHGADLWATVTVALPEASPAVAVIEALPVGDGYHQPGRAHGRHGGGAARPGHRGSGHHLPVLVPYFRRELYRGAQCSQLSRGRAHRDGGGPAEIESRGFTRISFSPGLRRP